jgi:tRNA(Ile)-lysidine synthetase-like protein
LEGFSPELSCPTPRLKGGVALSGGKDSLLLLSLLVERDGCDRWVALHIDHGVRVAESREEECRHVDHVCKALGVDLRRQTLPSGQGSSEEAMRDARYRALGELSVGLECIALGHHVLDQVETILMKILRGCDLGALEGMRASFEREGVAFVRPMLHWSEEEFLGMRGHEENSPFEDPSNGDPRYLRNRVRSELLPLLESLSPGWVGRLAGLGESAQVWKNGLEARLKELNLSQPWESMGEEHYRTPRGWLMALDPYLLKAWCREQLEWACGGAGRITRKHVDSFAEFAKSGDLGSHHLNFPGGWRLRGQKRWLHLLR